MKKRVFAVLLLGVMLIMAAQPVQAIAVQPYASTNAQGGLVHVSGSTYILWGSGTGIAEYKYVTASLYVNKGGWQFVTAVSNSGYTQSVNASKNVVLSSGYYEVVTTSVTSTGTSYGYSYWNI